MQETVMGSRGNEYPQGVPSRAVHMDSSRQDSHRGHLLELSLFKGTEKAKMSKYHHLALEREHVYAMLSL